MAVNWFFMLFSIYDIMFPIIRTFSLCLKFLKLITLKRTIQVKWIPRQGGQGKVLMCLMGTDLDERNMSPLHFNIEDKLSEAAVSRGIGRGIAESIL